MNTGILNDKICSGFPRCLYLWADAAVGGVKGAIGKSWPIAADRGVETFSPARVDVVVDFVYPLNVRTKATLTTKIAGVMGAKTGLAW